MNDRIAFGYLCDGLVQTIRHAADPAYPLWQAYYGDVQKNAVWMARQAMRHARRLGLADPYPKETASCSRPSVSSTVRRSA